MAQSGQQFSSYQQSSNEGNWGTTYRRYSRITPEMKQKLISLIIRDNKSIKNASQQLGINYSSAKFIFGQYRDKTTTLDINKIEQNAKQCNFVRLSQNQQDNLVVRSTIGGKFQGQTTQTKTIVQIYKSTLQ